MQEEEITAGQDDPMLRLISPVSSPNHDQKQDDAITLKTPKNLVIQNNNISGESTAEEEIFSNESVKSADDAIPQYTSPSEDSDLEYLKNTPTKGTSQLRVSQSFELNKSLVNKALRTFTSSRSYNTLTSREPSSEVPSQASRITDSVHSTDLNQDKGLRKEKGRPKKESTQIATKTNLDAESTNEANKPLTRSRTKLLASKSSQLKSNENDPQTTSDDCIIPTHAPAPSGSR